MLKSHNRYRYVPITERKPYAWPNGSRLAIFTALNVEVFPFAEGMGVELAPGQPQPDVVNYSWRDYGNRVGFWRLMHVFAERQVIPTIYVVGMALERNPQAAETMARQGCDVVDLAEGQTGLPLRWEEPARTRRAPTR